MLGDILFLKIQLLIEAALGRIDELYNALFV